MDIGNLNRRINIYEFVEKRDEFGGIEGEWIKIASRWARIEQQSGTETTDNNQVKAKVSTTITIRYMKELNEKHRIKYKEKLYEINSVIDYDSRHYKTIINCTELKDGI